MLLAEAVESGWFALFGAIVGGLIGVFGTFYTQQREQRTAQHKELVSLISQLLSHVTWVKSMTTSKSNMELWGVEGYKQHLEGVIKTASHLALLLDVNKSKEKAFLDAMNPVIEFAVKSEELPKGASKTFDDTARDLLRSYK